MYPGLSTFLTRSFEVRRKILWQSLPPPGFEHTEVKVHEWMECDAAAKSRSASRFVHTFQEKPLPTCKQERSVHYTRLYAAER